MSDVVPIKEVMPTPRAFTCCKDKFGNPRPMKKLANSSPRVKRMPDGTTRQTTVMVTKHVCEVCGNQQTTEQEL
jgi:hypothetical protein